VAVRRDRERKEIRISAESKWKTSNICIIIAKQRQREKATDGGIEKYFRSVELSFHLLCELNEHAGGSVLLLTHVAMTWKCLFSLFQAHCALKSIPRGGGEEKIKFSCRFSLVSGPPACSFVARSVFCGRFRFPVDSHLVLEIVVKIKAKL
jgi:hypothetical protein